MKKMFNLSIISGIVLIIGTAGNSDLGIVSITETIIMILSGFALCLSGVLIPKLISRKRRAHFSHSLKKSVKTSQHLKTKSYSPTDTKIGKTL